MDKWEAIVVIVVVLSFARVLRARFYADAGWMRVGRGKYVAVNQPQDDGSAAREAEALRRELAALQDRVKVLERIATDESRPRALADEIEALRDNKGDR